MMGKIVKNCLGCAIKPVIKLSFLCGLLPITSKCVHINNRAFAPKFTINKKCICFSILIILYLIYSFYNDCVTQKLDFIIYVDIILTTTSISCSAMGILQLKKKLEELTAIAVIVENCRYYRISGFICKETIRTSQQMFSCCLILIGCTFSNIIYVSMLDLSFSNYTNIAVKIFSRLIYAFIGYVFVFQAIMHIIIYNVLFLTTFKQIKVFLNSKIKIKSNIHFAKTNFDFINLEIYIKRLIKLYLQILATFRLYNSLMNKLILFFGVYFIASSIVSNYLLVILFYNFQKYICLYVVTFWIWILVIVATIFFITERILNVVSIILTFFRSTPLPLLTVKLWLLHDTLVCYLTT